jgi:hypothetical protein
MRHDLFGKPIFDSSRSRQPELFAPRTFFAAGYLDAVAGREPDPHGSAAYGYGFEAGRRDLGAGSVDEACAWRVNLAVGNVSE